MDRKWYEFPGAWILGMILAVAIALGGAWAINTFGIWAVVIPVGIAVIVCSDAKSKRPKKPQSR